MVGNPGGGKPRRKERGIRRQESALIGWRLSRVLKGVEEKRGPGRKKAPEKGRARCEGPPLLPPPSIPWSEEVARGGRAGTGLPPEMMPAGRGGAEAAGVSEWAASGASA